MSKDAINCERKMFGNQIKSGKCVLFYQSQEFWESWKEWVVKKVLRRESKKKNRGRQKLPDHTIKIAVENKRTWTGSWTWRRYETIRPHPQNNEIFETKRNILEPNPLPWKNRSHNQPSGIQWTSFRLQVGPKQNAGSA